MIRIGIVGQDHDGKFGINTAYASLIEEVGGIPIIISPIELRYFPHVYPIDVLLLPGGADVGNIRYNILPSFRQGYQNPFLEYFDDSILPEIIRQGIPIFGVCRGLQTLNVQFGGTLHQHIWRHPYSSYREELVHEILTEDLEGHTWKFKVNSLHHQAIKNLAPNFRAIGTSIPDNIIEAIIDDERKIVAVQWHPEEIRDDFSVSLFKSIIS